MLEVAVRAQTESGFRLVATSSSFEELFSVALGSRVSVTWPLLSTVGGLLLLLKFESTDCSNDLVRFPTRDLFKSYVIFSNALFSFDPKYWTGFKVLHHFFHCAANSIYFNK